MNPTYLLIILLTNHKSLSIDGTDMSLKIDMSAVSGVGILRAFSTRCRRCLSL